MPIDESIVRLLENFTFPAVTNWTLSNGFSFSLQLAPNVCDFAETSELLCVGVKTITILLRHTTHPKLRSQRKTTNPGVNWSKSRLKLLKTKHSPLSMITLLSFPDKSKMEYMRIAAPRARIKLIVPSGCRHLSLGLSEDLPIVPGRKSLCGEFAIHGRVCPNFLT